MKSNFMTNKEIEKYTEEMTKFKYKCKCGHTVIMPEWVDKQLCHWCNRYVFKNKEDEFKYRLKERLK